MNIQEIGKRIAAMRKQLGLTQDQLAEKLNCSPKHISYAERGASLMSLEKLIDLCVLFDCSLDYLVLGYERSGSIARLPNFVLDIFDRDDEQEQKLFLAYVNQYKKLREDLWK